MTALTLIVLVVLAAYLIGAIPFGFLVARLRGVDILREGSGNIGATNVGRVLGRRFGILVFLFDFLKGAFPTFVAGALAIEHREELGPWLGHDGLPVLAGLAAFLGHLFPVYLRFRGGKGVATGAGAALALMPVPMAIVVGIFVVLVFGVRIVSVGSIAATIMYPVMAVVWRQPLAYIVGACVMAAVVLFAHRKNMVRLWRSQEHRFTAPWSRKKGETPAAPDAATAARETAPAPAATNHTSAPDTSPGSF